MIRKGFYCLLICILLRPDFVFAQLNNGFISDHIELNEKDSDAFGINLMANSYMRNTEYFNNIELGRTLFGYQLNPSFFIQPHPNVKLQAGVFLRSDYGAEPYFTQVIPTYSLLIKKNNTSFTFGTIEGALAHRLIEPLFDINSSIERRIENGFQFKHDGEDLFADVWINWEKYIERGSPYKEQFTAGFNVNPVFIRTDNGFTLSIPFQGTAFHKGGQITKDTSNMLMVFNAALGMDLDQTWQEGFIRELKASVYSVYYKEKSNSGYMPYTDGYGNFANLYVKTSWLGVMLSYWNAVNYIAPRGTPIYQSVSIDKPGYTEGNRELIFLRFLYEKEIYPKLFLVARYEPYFDVRNKLYSDYSYSIYLTYRQQFNLGKIRR